MSNFCRQTANDLTGEHSCIMLSILNQSSDDLEWLTSFFLDFRRRFISLLSFQFRLFHPSLALSVISNNVVTDSHQGLYTFHVVLIIDYFTKLVIFGVQEISFLLKTSILLVRKKRNKVEV